MKYEAIIFDLDGTLLDTLGDIMAVLNKSLSDSGINYQYSKEEGRYLLGGGARYLIKRAVEPFHIPLKEEEQVYRQYLQNYHLSPQIDHTSIYEGMDKLLAKLKEKGVRLFVLTNKPHAIAERVINYFLPGIFEAVYGQVEHLPVKPDPTILNHLLENHNVKREKTLFVGDTEMDLELASNGGVDSCFVTYGFRTLEDIGSTKRIYEVDTPLEILKLVD
ncbi:MAG: HAD family hydrolase [Bacilli bacterium]